jgi:hypothetical protein
MKLSFAAENVLKFHQAKGEPAHAGFLIGIEGIPDQAALNYTYKELVEAGKVEPVSGKIGVGRPNSGYQVFKTLYRCK